MTSSLPFIFRPSERRKIAFKSSDNNFSDICLPAWRECKALVTSVAHADSLVFSNFAIAKEIELSCTVFWNISPAVEQPKNMDFGYAILKGFNTESSLNKLLSENIRTKVFSESKSGNTKSLSSKCIFFVINWMASPYKYCCIYYTSKINV